MIMIWIVAWPYVLASWGHFEESSESDGLPGLFVLKSVILVLCAALGLQGVSLALRSVLVLMGRTEFAGVVLAIDEDT
jgi:TRAP-type mannitol/chloroaromatic compound transport system permease small subunit